MSLVAKITGLASGLLQDESKLDTIISKGFNHFDKDRSGFIEAAEINAAVQHVLTLAHLPHVPPQFIESAFAKVAGVDAKLDRTEFVNLFKRLLAKIHGNPEPVAEAAAAAGYTAH